jgi:type IV pilus assembly protein PilF
VNSFLQKAVLCGLSLLLAACVTKTQQLGVDPTSGAKAIGDARNRAQIHTQLAAKYFERNQDAVALAELKDAIIADPKYAPAYSMLALVYMDLQQNDQAAKNFEQALRLAPNDSDINNNYGWFLCQTGSPRESIAYFQTALKNPLYETPYVADLNIGLCSEKFNDLDQADEYYQRALRFEPNFPKALLNLARLWYGRGRYADARGLIARYNKIVEPNAESLWLALRVERKLGDRSTEGSLAVQLRRNFSTSREYQEFLKGNFE